MSSTRPRSAPSPDSRRAAGRHGRPLWRLPGHDRVREHDRPGSLGRGLHRDPVRPGPGIGQPAAIWLRSDLARLLIYRGRLDEARSHLERGARIAAAGPDRVWQLEETVIFKFADGRDDDARRAVDDIIQGCPEPERDMTLWWSLVGALRGEVRRLEAARARRDDADADETLAVARSRLALLRLSGRSAKETGGSGPLLDAHLAWADAEATRMDGRSDPDAWAEAARRRELIGQPYHRAIGAAARSGGPAALRRRADGGRGAPGSRAHHRGTTRGGAIARRDRRVRPPRPHRPGTLRRRATARKGTRQPAMASRSGSARSSCSSPTAARTATSGRPSSSARRRPPCT